MVEQARQQEPMTVETFLDWDDGTDTRYELISGQPVAMSPPKMPHALIVTRVARILDLGLRSPCRAATGAGLRHPEQAHNFRIPDLVVTCAEEQGAWVEEPRLIVEVLSPSTQRADSTHKLAFYRDFSSVEQILLIWTDARRVEVWEREGDHWKVHDFIGSASLKLCCCDEPVPLDEIYAPIGL